MELRDKQKVNPRDRLPISGLDRALLTDDATPSPVSARAVSGIVLLVLGH